MICDPLLKQTLDLLGKDRIDTTSYSMSEETAKSLARRLDEGAATGNYSRVSALPVDKKQEIVEHIFNSRKQEGVLGITPYQSEMDVHYFGTTTQMEPLEFLKLATRRRDLSVKETRKEFAYFLAKQLSKGKDEVKLAPPKLWLNLKDGKLIVEGHEGRHRSDAIFELLGNKVKLPVDIQVVNDGAQMRARNIPSNIFDIPLVTQDGHKTTKTLRDLLGASGVMMLMDKMKDDK